MQAASGTVPKYESFFSYNITRPYPYRWFTPVTIVGAIVLATLLNFLNFAANGYDVVIHTSTDPNATMAGSTWLNHWPSYLTDKVKPMYQSVDIPVSSKIFTNQAGLTYTLTAAWQTWEDASVDLLPSLTYFNNILEDCSVNSIQMNLEALDRTAYQHGYSEWGVIVSTYLTCKVAGTRVNLTKTYDYIPDSIPFDRLGKFLATNFLNRDKDTRASLWWGESAMSNYYVYLTKTMQDIRKDDAKHFRQVIRKGTIYFTPSSLTADITNLDFFFFDFRFRIDQSYGGYDVIVPASHPIQNSTIASVHDDNTYPNVWITADSLAKSAYSTVLTDLGQMTAWPNFSLAHEHQANAAPGPETTVDYNEAKGMTGPPGLTPGVFRTTYICQVPRLKSTGNLIISVLVADLVLLQLVWKLFTLSTTAWLKRSRPNAAADGKSYQRIGD